MKATLRKTEVNLVTLGTGVVLFGAWTFIKFILTAILYDNNLFEKLDDLGEMRDVVVAISYILVFFIATIVFLINFYAGMSARAEGKGKRKTVLYLIVTGIIVFFDLIIFAAEVYILFSGEYSLTHIVITLIIDFTALAIHFEMLINAVNIRRLRKKEALA